MGISSTDKQSISEKGGVKKLIFTPPFYGDRKNASERTNGTTNPFTKGFVGYPKAYDGTSRGDVCS